MAALTPPVFVQSGGQTAQTARLAVGAAVLSSGVLNPADLLVSAPGGAMTVSVAAGQGWLVGSRTNQGTYHVVNDAPLTLTVAASDPTNPRYDIVVAQIQDAAYSGSVNDFDLSIIQGTAASAPAEPAIPADSFQLCRITVGAGVAAVSSTDLLDRRVRAVLRGAVFSAAVAADPGAVVRAVTSQTGNLQEWQDNAGTVLASVRSDGVLIPPGAATTLTWSKQVQMGSGTLAWTHIGDKLVSVTGAVACTTADTGNYRLNANFSGIPAPLSSYNCILQCWITDTNGDNPSMYPLILIGGTWFVAGSSPGYTGAVNVGQVLQISGTYRIAA